jgi:hypothetical protein
MTEKKLLLDVYAHNWGFLIPCESGIVFTQQTGGISCGQRELEGVFYPLQKPREIKIPTMNQPGKCKTILLLPLLQKANYNYKKNGDIWKRIKETMHFDFEYIDAPKGMPESDEGFAWIKLTKFESGWGHMDWVEALVGKTMVLIYPNCD